MKKIYLCLNTLICLSFLFTLNSCTTDTSFVSNDTPVSADTKNEINYYNSRKGDVMPANSENPYDTAGRVHNELSESYASDNSTIASNAGSIFRVHRDFNNSKGMNYRPLSVGKVSSIVPNNSNDFSDIIANSNMTATGKLTLSDFIHFFQFLCKKEDLYVVLYDFVVKFERGILTNTLLTERDKKIILTTSSIVRYSTYASKTESVEAIDPDWTKLITHIISGIEITN